MFEVNLYRRYRSGQNFELKILRSIGIPQFTVYIYIYIYTYIRGSLNKFLDFFRTGTFIDIIHMKL